MKAAIIIVLLIIIVGLLLYLVIKKYKKHNKSNMNSQLPSVQNGTVVSVEEDESNELTIPMEMLPVDSIDESALVEIKDHEVLSRIDSVIPGLADVGLKVANAASNHSETLYKAVIPKGAKLAKSRTMKGAVRGFYRGTKGIGGQANLVEVKDAGIKAANLGAGAMQVASMVVGQYYMSQINSKLEEVSKGINRIESFQDNEFRSRVFALVVQVKKMCEFNSEIIGNDQLISTELNHLNELEDECIKLLGQANLTLVDFTKKNDLDFKTYEEEIQRAQTWYEYQQSLLDVLYRIADLKYAFQFGKASRKYCGASLPTYTKQVSKTNNKLIGWHESNAIRLEVDISELKRRRTGFDRAIHWIPGRFVKEQNYRTLEEHTADMIETQITGKGNDIKQDKSDLYNEDVQIVSKDGKMYYLPQSK